MTSFDFSTSSPEGARMGSLYQPHAVIASCCGHMMPPVSAEPAHGHCPQPIGRLLHVKRNAHLAAFSIRINLRVHSVPDLPPQRDNFSFATPRKHSPV